MLKGILGHDPPSPPLADIKIVKDESSLQSRPMDDLEMQLRDHQGDREVCDGLNSASFDSVALRSADWRENGEEDQDGSSIGELQTVSSANDEAHLIRPAPVVLRPA